MKSYFRILAFAKPYFGNAILNGISNIFMIVFSLVSISSLIPILDMIFGAKVEKLEGEAPAFAFDIDTVKEIINHKIGAWILDVGSAQALAYVCIL